MIDLLMVLGFLAYAVYSGFSSKDEAGKDLDEYFLAGRSLDGTKAGMSMAATQFAADTPLLVMGLVATGGLFMLWRLWIYGLAFLVMGFIFSTKWRRAMVITDAELTDIRYSGKHIPHLRFLKAVYYGTIINCVVLAMVLVAAMRISETFLLWHEWLPEGFYSILKMPIESFDLALVKSTTGLDDVTATTNNLFSIFMIVGFTTLYSTTGGLRSVVATDMVQFIFAMLGTIVYAGFIVYKSGGFGEMMTKLSSLYPNSVAKITSLAPNTSDALAPFLILISMQWLFQMNSDGTGYLAQRSMACKSDKDARWATVLFTWVQVLLRSFFWIIIALGLMVIYPFEEGAAITDMFTAKREMLFVTGINEILPPGFKGLMLVGMLGALTSTVDTHLNWGASYWSNDIYKDIICKQWLKKEANNKTLVWVARVSNIGILLVALIIMFNLGSIKNAWSLSLLFGAGMGAVLIMRWLWEGITLYSEVAAIASSIIIAPILLFTVKDEWLRILIMSVSTTIIPILAAKFGPKTEPAKLDAFYQRVSPQGFWKKTAGRIGEDEKLPFKKLKASLFEIILIALSVYLLLIGSVKFIFQTGSGNFWVGIILSLIGLGLIPVWKKRL
jgi:SSS family solute:Na+ symporter